MKIAAGVDHLAEGWDTIIAFVSATAISVCNVVQ